MESRKHDSKQCFENEAAIWLFKLQSVAVDLHITETKHVYDDTKSTEFDQLLSCVNIILC